MVSGLSVPGAVRRLVVSLAVTVSFYRFVGRPGLYGRLRFRRRLIAKSAVESCLPHIPSAHLYSRRDQPFAAYAGTCRRLSVNQPGHHLGPSAVVGAVRRLVSILAVTVSFTSVKLIPTSGLAPTSCAGSGILRFRLPAVAKIRHIHIHLFADARHLALAGILPHGMRTPNMRKPAFPETVSQDTGTPIFYICFPMHFISHSLLPSHFISGA